MILFKKTTKTLFWWIVASLITVGFFTSEVLLLRYQNKEVQKNIKKRAVELYRNLRQSESEFHYEYFTRGPTNKSVLCLTFDDGPYADKTPAILDILKSKMVPGTFFLVGANVDKAPEVLYRIILNGNDIGNHSYFHNTFDLDTSESWRAEIDRANAAISNLLGLPPLFFRAPGCRYTKEALSAINSLNMVRVDCSNNGFDYDARDSATISRRLFSRLKAGDVILLHDSDPYILKILPTFIDEARAKGFSFVSLRDMLLLAKSEPTYKVPYSVDGTGEQLPEVSPP